MRRIRLQGHNFAHFEAPLFVVRTLKATNKGILLDTVRFTAGTPRKTQVRCSQQRRLGKGTYRTETASFGSKMPSFQRKVGREGEMRLYKGDVGLGKFQAPDEAERRATCACHRQSSTVG